MYESGKPRAIKTFQGWEKGVIKDNDGGGEFSYDTL
jgi:hypothetical protein